MDKEKLQAALKLMVDDEDQVAKIMAALADEQPDPEPTPIDYASEDAVKARIAEVEAERDDYAFLSRVKDIPEGMTMEDARQHILRDGKGNRVEFRVIKNEDAPAPKNEKPAEKPKNEAAKPAEKPVPNAPAPGGATLGAGGGDGGSGAPAQAALGTGRGSFV